MKRAKRKLKFSSFIILLLFLSIIGYGTYYFVFNSGFKLSTKDGFISSSDKSVKLYDLEFNVVGEANRGDKIKILSENLSNGETKYDKVIINNKTYLVNEGSTTSEYDNIIKEQKMYVRTSVTVYKDLDTSKILGFFPKGSEIDITGFDELKDGVVNRYKVKYNDTFGYVYGKYLVSNLDEAKAPYDKEGIYKYHENRNFSYELYGGSASNLDYYPYEKVKFENNGMPTEVRAFYLNAGTKVLGDVDSYIELAKNSNINAFVVDIKDGGLAFQAECAKEYSMTSYNAATYSVSKYKEIIDKIKNAGFYVVGRIVAFNDPLYAADNPDDSISGTKWPSVFSRRAWEYNVELAKESVLKIGFNEIQFDYVRFPEAAYSMSKNGNDFKNKYNEEKGQAVQNFLFYATDEIHKVGAYLSVDVFGECANTYVTAYGQYWPSISNIVDVISGMPYPDHFNKYEYGFKDPVWTTPYELLVKWGSAADARQKEIKTPALVRTWIQAYDTHKAPATVYDANMVSKEIKGLYDAGLKDGYITWNSVSSLTKYTAIAPAFKKSY